MNACREEWTKVKNRRKRFRESFLLACIQFFWPSGQKEQCERTMQAPVDPSGALSSCSLPSLLYWDLEWQCWAITLSNPCPRRNSRPKRLTRERNSGAREHLVWNGLCRTPKWINIIYRRPVGLKMNGANAALGTQLKDSRRSEIHKKASFNLQTRLLNKARRMEWGRRAYSKEE